MGASFLYLDPLRLGNYTEVSRVSLIHSLLLVLAKSDLAYTVFQPS